MKVFTSHFRGPVVLSMFAALVSGCSEGTIPTADGSLPVSSAPNASNLQILPIRERIRAIAARDKAARGSNPHRESFTRVYDEYGRVAKEVVVRNGKAIVRPSTIPASIAAQPLRSFLPQPVNGAASIRSGTLVAGAYTDTLNSIPVAVTDSLWTDTGSYLTDYVRDASVADYVMISNTWYANGADTDTLTKGLGADIYVVENGNVVAHEIIGSTFTDGLAIFSADTAGQGFLRASVASSSLSGIVRAPGRVTAESTGKPSPGTLSLARVLFEQAYGDICESELHYYQLSVVALSATAAWGLYSCFKNPFKCGQARSNFKAANVATGIAFAAYVWCVDSYTGAIRMEPLQGVAK